jgi:recombination protein RecA
VRIEVRKGEPIKDGSDTIGNRTKCKVIKNKVAPPFKTCEFDMIFGHGISRTGEVLDYAQELGIIKKSGAWFSYEDMRIGQGRENTKKFLDDNPAVMAEIEDKIWASADKLEGEEEEGAEPAADAAPVEAPAPAEEEKPADKPKRGKAKKSSVVISADDDFEEFSIDDINE